VCFGTDPDNLVKIITQTNDLLIAQAVLQSLVGLGDYSTVYYWRVDTIWPESELSAEGDVWSFDTEHSRIFPVERRSDYDEDWTDDADYLVAGGGRYKNQIIAIGHEKVYFGEV